MEQKEVTAADVKRLMLYNYKRLDSGEISAEKAAKANTILADILAAVEAGETQERLKELEKTIALNAKYGADDENTE